MRLSGKRTMKITAILSLLVLGMGAYFLLPVAAVPAAYAAKMMCSGIFVSKRPPEAVLAEELSPTTVPEMRYAQTSIDYQNWTVDASWLRIFHRRAVFRDGLGCTLTSDIDATPPRRHLGVLIKASESETSPPLRRASSRIQTVVDESFTEPDFRLPRRTRAVVVLHHGQIVAERYAPGIKVDTPLLGWSMTKSVMNALTGILVRDGKLTLNTTTRMPTWNESDDPRNRIAVHHLLHMASGLEFSSKTGGPFDDTVFMLFGANDGAAFAATKPLTAAPGSVWSYSSAPTMLLSKVIRDTVGENAYLEFPRHALFEPLGMKSAVMELDASGTFAGAAFMYATARDWARFGQLYLHDGMWEGKRILPAGWVQFSTTPSPASPAGEYGAHFWLKLPNAYNDGDESRMPPDTFHAIGHEGQFITIIPSRDLVIVRLGLTRAPHAWNHEAFVNAVLHALENPDPRYAGSPENAFFALTHTNG